MHTFSHTSIIRLSSFLRELHEWHTVATLQEIICGRLHQLIPGHNIFIGDHDMAETRINGCAVTRMFTTPEFMSIVNSCAGQHPLWEPIRTGGQEVRVLSDYASKQAWEGTRLCAEALGPEGVGDHISVEFGERSKQIFSVGVFRESRGFSACEREIMSLLIPHLELAFANALRRERLENESGGLQGGETRAFRVELDADGKPAGVPVELQAWMSPQGGWPAGMKAWLTHTRRLLDQGSVETVPPPWSADFGNARMEARLWRQRQGPGYQLVIRVSNQGSEAAGLSAREREVLHWIGQGKTNEEIGIILGVSFFTVKTHVKNILRKLDVCSRAEAVRRILESGV